MVMNNNSKDVQIHILNLNSKQNESKYKKMYKNTFDL